MEIIRRAIIPWNSFDFLLFGKVHLSIKKNWIFGIFFFITSDFYSFYCYRFIRINMDFSNKNKPDIILKWYNMTLSLNRMNQR